MNNIYQLMTNQMQKNPNLINSVMGKTFLRSLYLRDDEVGKEMFDDIIASMKKDKEEVLSETMSFFGCGENM